MFYYEVCEILNGNKIGKTLKILSDMNMAEAYAKAYTDLLHKNVCVLIRLKEGGVLK